jgi:transposase InsO family protein
MPWQETWTMKEREFFIEDFLKHEASNFYELCRLYGISRKTGYKWVDRYHLKGIGGLCDLSRARKSQEHQTDPRLVEEVILLRRTNSDWGPLKLYKRLMRKAPDRPWPKPSTIAKILKRRGLVNKVKRRARPVNCHSPFVGYYGPNAVWTADHKGEMPIQYGKVCLPLTVQDGFSRYLLAVDAVPSTSGYFAKAVFERLFCQFGMPDALRTDNGPPFATVGLGGIGQMNKWWIKLGIKPERIDPGRPDQNGRHERMHRTLKAAVGERMKKATSKTMQPVLNDFRANYNDERPHEALNHKTPSDVYRKSTRQYPVKLKDPTYPDGLLLERVSKQGLLYFMGQGYQFPRIFRQELLGMKPVKEEKWQVYFGPVLLGAITPFAFRSEGKGVGKRRFWPYKHCKCYPCE